MEKVIIYKRQGDGKDSWFIHDLDENGKDIQSPELVFEDPALPPKKVKIDNIDIDSMTVEDLQKLANKLKPLMK
jgi:hypothetical protein